MMEKSYTKSINFFSVFTAGLKDHSSLGSIYQTSERLGDSVTIHFTQNLTAQQETDCDTYVNTFVDSPSVQEQMAIYLEQDVDAFVKKMIFEFAAENIALGITQAGKTKAVADELRDLNYYMRAYSLYEVVVEIDRLIAAGIDPTLSPFMTDARMTEFQNKILEFLA